MRKTISVLLSAMLLLFTAAGCGDGNSGVTQSADEAGTAEFSHSSQPEENAAVEREPMPEDEPDNDWQFDAPENHGVDGTRLAALHEAADQTELYAIVTVKDGVIIDEYYTEGYDENSVFGMASCTKSVTSALVGIAIDQGLISGVDVLLSDYYPHIAQSDDPRKREIALEHLLTQTSGLEWYEWDGGTMFGELIRSENWVDFVLDRPMAAQPGTLFNYTTGGSHLLAAILEQAVGQSAYDYAVETLFDPLGMDSVEWSQDPQGITGGGNGISMSARDAAKFGQLYLDDGRWRGEQIVPKSWVEQSTSTRADGKPSSGTYGYQWWIKSFGEKEYETFYAMGHGGQFIFVVPQLRLVTVMTSQYAQNTYAPWPYFSDYILAACGESEETQETRQ